MKEKQLSSPIATGGGGVNFETRVQASFVTLMLTRGHAPCLPCWPIVEIKLQGKIDDFNTDDIIVFVENSDNKERRKLLGQIKLSIAITEYNKPFGEVIQAAWKDFNNSAVFSKNKDIIALITGPLSLTDVRTVSWLLNQTRTTVDVDEFFRNVEQRKFSPPKSKEKLKVFQHHLKAANGGNDVSRDELYDFLKHFRLLGYDLGNECGVVQSLLHSHISQFQQQDPQRLWSRVVEFVRDMNKDAGTITQETIREDISDAFKQRVVVEMPKDQVVRKKAETDWTQHPDATYLALAVLIGSWSEKSECDREAITQLLGISHNEWSKKAREILHCPDRPLSLKNGIWKVVNRAELWNQLGSRALDQNLATFGSLAVSVLKERDPAFELPAEKRYAASIHGKVLKYSPVLRKGIAGGLAMLGCQPQSCANCSQGKAETTCILVIRELLTDADWVLWGSLNDLLPALAEAAPYEFLDAVEKAMRVTPCPFDELFSQEGKGITGSNYISGLLWALEGLAWEKQYLVRAGVALAELASHDPGGEWDNRPSNSLVTIFLPWWPQTLAPVKKRKVAVKTILKEWPDIAWNLIIQLLPNQEKTSSGSHKPSWRKTIPDDWGKGLTVKEWKKQVDFYAKRAVAAAGEDPARLSVLVDHFDKLPPHAFDQLLKVLTSRPISELPEEQRLLIWDHLTKFTKKHRRFSDAKWALSDELVARIEHVAGQLAPTNPFHLYQHLFTHFDFYEEKADPDTRRESAISEIFQQDGLEGVIRFAESVSSPRQVGHALGVIANDVFERTFLPHFLNSADNKRKALVSAFIQRRYHLKGWEWCDALDKSDWTHEQVGQFLSCLPFSKETWDRASQYLQAHESEYWTRADANCAAGDLAIEKLIEHGRPHAAINCLDKMRHDGQSIDSKQCVRAFLASLSTSEPRDAMNSYHIVELIKFLQVEPEVKPDDLFRIEWAYLRFINNGAGDAAPQRLESRLANDPEFFCEIIQLIYRSKKEDQPPRESTEESKSIAENAWLLLYLWKTPPGTQQDETFSEERFTEWLQRVKAICTESGHLETALNDIGKVLINTPPDPDGLWIHRAVAAALNDNDCEADKMRKGYMIGAYNSRGVHDFDPSGKPEKELAEQFQSKAEDVENAGFQRFAVILKDLARVYDRQAESMNPSR